MDKEQPNLDLQTKDNVPTVSFDFQKIKPGGDYFIGNVFSLFILFIYILLFYRNFNSYDDA